MNLQKVSAPMQLAISRKSRFTYCQYTDCFTGIKHKIQGIYFEQVQFVYPEYIAQTYLVCSLNYFYCFIIRWCIQTNKFCSEREKKKSQFILFFWLIQKYDLKTQKAHTFSWTTKGKLPKLQSNSMRKTQILKDLYYLPFILCFLLCFSKKTRSWFCHLRRIFQEVGSFSKQNY